MSFDDSDAHDSGAEGEGAGGTHTAPTRAPRVSFIAPLPVQGSQSRLRSSAVAPLLRDDSALSGASQSSLVRGWAHIECELLRLKPYDYLLVPAARLVLGAHSCGPFAFVPLPESRRVVLCC
jgi:hypothetical protein